MVQSVSKVGSTVKASILDFKMFAFCQILLNAHLLGLIIVCLHIENSVASTVALRQKGTANEQYLFLSRFTLTVLLF